MRKLFFALLVMFVVVFLTPLIPVAYSDSSVYYPDFEQGTTGNNLPYMTGGVGLDERAAMTKMAWKYNLKLEFARPSGAYLAKINVRIQNSKGSRVVDMESDGPWFFAQLPPGDYEVTVSHLDKKEAQKRRCYRA